MLHCVFAFGSPQSQLRNHEKEHDSLSSDTSALTAADGMATIKEAEQETAGEAGVI